jgi:hypothetical protein
MIEQMTKPIIDISRYRTAQIVEMLIMRDGLFCTLPGCKNPTKFDERNFATIDHTMPKSMGGHPYDFNNMTIMHFPCNNVKGSRVYDENGELPPLVGREYKTKVEHRDPCETCYDGRLLIANEICDICFSAPQPATFPKYLQRTPNQCDHFETHCWLCTLGFVERQTILNRMIDGPS